MMEKPKLKPCPFCGGEAEFDVFVDNSKGRKMLGVTLCSVGVKCTGCSIAKLTMPTTHVDFEDVDSFVESEKIRVSKFWNEREL